MRAPGAHARLPDRYSSCGRLLAAVADLLTRAAYSPAAEVSDLEGCTVLPTVP
jgi:hypothetical protein